MSEIPPKSAVAVLDARTWVEIHHDDPDGYARAELHRPVRSSSVGWVDEPEILRSEDAEAAVRVLLRGRGYEIDDVLHRLHIAA